MEPPTFTDPIHDAARRLAIGHEWSAIAALLASRTIDPEQLKERVEALTYVDRRGRDDCLYFIDAMVTKYGLSSIAGPVELMADQ